MFGFILKESLPVSKVLKVLARLEITKHPGTSEQVGGYGAGLAVVLKDGDVISEKVGGT
jgi:hypothetical protein